MIRKFYSKEQLPQRSQEWFVARMGKFTSSDVWQLFTEPTQEKRAKAAVDSVKTGNWKVVSLHTITEQKEINFACKWLEFDDDTKKKVKAEILGNEGFSKAADLVLQFHNAFNELHCFSTGAEEFIWFKAWDFVFPKPEVKGMTAAMERGQELEPLAIAAYLRKFKNLKPSEISFVELGQDIGSSPDLLVTDPKQKQKGGCEVKCRERKGFALAFKRLKEPSDLLKYSDHKKAFYQCHHQIYTCGLDWMDYVHYNDELDAIYDPVQNKMVPSAYQHKCIHSVRIHREQAMIQQFEKVLPLAIELRNKYLREILK